MLEKPEFRFITDEAPHDGSVVYSLTNSSVRPFGLWFLDPHLEIATYTRAVESELFEWFSKILYSFHISSLLVQEAKRQLHLPASCETNNYRIQHGGSVPLRRPLAPHAALQTTWNIKQYFVRYHGPLAKKRGIVLHFFSSGINYIFPPLGQWTEWSRTLTSARLLRRGEGGGYGGLLARLANYPA